MKLDSRQLRSTAPKRAQKLLTTISRQPLVLVLDNILDTYNIGSFFRLADAVAAQKLYLCGPVVTPPNLKIHRASIGTWKFVPWEQSPSTIEVVKHLKKSGYQIVACEQTPNSVHHLKAKYQFPLALVAGNEDNGVGESVLKLCDLTVEIPLYGINKSLNVLTATSIIAYNAISTVSSTKN